MANFQPRPKQQAILQYQRGRMGVSAVPGSGKTSTLSYLAARLVSTVELREGQEILIVTLVKSAVGNFAQSMSRYLTEEFRLLAGLGYRVCTLHSLANDIVRERPGLVGLDNNFTVLSEREADDVLQDVVTDWLRLNGDSANAFLAEDHLNNNHTRSHHWADAVKSMAGNFIRRAKDLQLTEADVRNKWEQYNFSLPLVEICLPIYEMYERGLRYRGAVDFQDLIRLALRLLDLDNYYLARLRDRFPYILEDEAQDSSELQEKILRKLVGENGNWVRVGDPNQAIFETFTTANPRFLRDFLNEPGVQKHDMPNSGRSTRSIIDLANHLIDWSLDHPNPDIRAKMPLSTPYIEPTPEGDPQGNPPDAPEAIILSGTVFTSQQEREAVIESLKKWLPENKDKTVAVLLPINASGASLVQAFRAAGIPYIENLRSTTGTRAVVGTLLYLLDHLLDPKNPGGLANAYRVWRRDERGDEEAEKSIDEIAGEIRKIQHVEDFIAPRTRNWLDEVASEFENAALHEHLLRFRNWVSRWSGAVDLPIDQLILTIAGDIFTLETEIATAYSVALHMKRVAELNPDFRLPEFTEELRAIAKGQRQFAGIGDDDDAFDPDKHKGEVTVTTMHKAKGLEWDRVYLMSVNNYDYPSGDPYDTFIGEKWFIRDNLNLDAEADAQLRALVDNGEYIEGQATRDARVDYAAERLRLLYVGITRARRELIVTWNTGRRGDQLEARPIAALRGWWEAEQAKRENGRVTTDGEKEMP